MGHRPDTNQGRNNFDRKDSMFLALPLLAGFLVGKIVGGSFRNLAAAPLRVGWLFLVGFGIQLVLYSPLTDTQPWDIRYGHIFYLASLLLLVGGLLLNVGRLRWPVVLMAAGAALNLIVIAANGGAMPVDGGLLSQVRGSGLVNAIRNHQLASNVVMMTPGTRLGLLGDHIRILSSVYSIGDVILGIGGFLLPVLEMRRRGRVVEPETGLSRTSGAAQAA